MIAAGQLRHRIKIQKPPETRDNFGQRPKGTGWTDVADAYAKVEFLNGTEREAAGQLVATATHRITLRVARAYTLETKHRIQFRSRNFSIGAVNNVDELNGIWVALCTETAA